MGTLREHDVVALLRDLPEAGLEAGEIGTVVHVYAGGKGYEVEFVSARGSSLGGEGGVVTVMPDHVLKLRKLPKVLLPQ